ncbi:MAG: alpha/beta fold hydrolase [Pseudomonadota bacterium]
MASFLLVHGSWHGAWCWYKLTAHLEAAGHRVIALDLPSLGSDKTPVAEITADSWSDHLIERLDAEPEPVILVGHSRGGMLISKAAEARPEKVARLVYLCAFLLQDGETIGDVIRSPANAASTISDSLELTADGLATTVREEALEALFYNRSPREDVVLAKLLAQPEANAPLLAPVALSDARFGGVPRSYIECLQDNAIRIDLQRQMVSHLPCEPVITMDTDHSPFFSAPEELARHLESLVG